jgi:hypothetical protein
MTTEIHVRSARLATLVAIAALAFVPETLLLAQGRTGAPAPPGSGPAAAAAPRPRPRPAPPAGQVAEEPIRCWWKTDRTAVSVGERFAVVLTCAALEAGQTIVVPNVSQLEGGAIQLTPFEVVSSTRRADVVATPWRYVQFEYTVRLLADGFFGQDVSIPPLTVTYNFQTADGNNTGRDQSYVLPALQMRVLSLVPRGATDIRDTSAMTFGDIESARFRATVARVTSWIATAFAVVLAALALLRGSQRFRKQVPEAERQVGDVARLGAAAAVLRSVRSDAASAGWSAELARRALPALRMAGASALGRPVAQQRVGRDAEVREGQLVVRRGWLRRGRTLLSASTTRANIDAAASQKGLSGRARAALVTLGPAIETFSVAAYGRGAAPPDGDELTSALDRSLEAVKSLRTGALWPVRTVTAIARTFSSV